MFSQDKLQFKKDEQRSFKNLEGREQVLLIPALFADLAAPCEAEYRRMSFRRYVLSCRTCLGHVLC